MRKVLIALSLGLGAAIIDIMPMVVQQMNRYAIVSAFLHWLVLGLIIPFVKWNMRSWIKGAIIGIISAVPVMVLVFEKEPEALAPIAIASVILGALVGLLGKKWVG